MRVGRLRCVIPSFRRSLGPSVRPSVRVNVRHAYLVARCLLSNAWLSIFYLRHFSSFFCTQCTTLASAVVQLFVTEAPSHDYWRKISVGVATFVKDSNHRYCKERTIMCYYTFNKDNCVTFLESRIEFNQDKVTCSFIPSSAFKELFAIAISLSKMPLIDLSWNIRSPRL